MKKRVVSLLLALVMLTSLLPTAVWAEDAYSVAPDSETQDVLQEQDKQDKQDKQDEQEKQEQEKSEEQDDLALAQQPMLAAVMPAAMTPQGAGTATDPYRISKAEELAWLAQEVNAGRGASYNAVLCNDIDLKNEEWTPIGKNYSYVYKGTFDGGGYTISGLKIDSTDQYQALFGYVKGGTIKNLTVAGSVTSSKQYTAGIVAYGNPVTVTNCTNEVSVTATEKGYAAGVVASASTNSEVMGCTNRSAIIGCGDYVGGIVGAGSSIKTISNCFNYGSVANNGKPGGYAYCTGGIAGGVGSSSTVTRCGNTGVVTSAIKRTGGVVGGAAGTISACFNTGTVTGIYGVGGVAGGASTKDVKITDCYNTGAVICEPPSATFTDSNAKGVGGIIGDPSSARNTGIVLTNCYNAGAVTNNYTTADVVVGGVIGSSAAKNITAKNCYYLAIAGLSGDGADASAAGMTGKTAEQLRSAELVAALGGSYIARDSGYPILGWQDPNAEYTVKFTLSPATALVTVKRGDETVTPASDGSYQLKNGVYTYEVSAAECQTETGSFTVAYAGQTISITLKEKLYDVKFTTTPVDAVLAVDGRTPEADGRTYRLPKSGSPYAYTLKAFGYEDKSGTFTVTDGDNAQTVTLTKLPTQKVTFGAVTAADGKDITPVISVTCTAWPEQTLTAVADGSYGLPAGEYSYAVSCAGYKTVRGTFTVTNTAVTLPAVQLEVQTAWDGATYTEPQKNADGVYLIGAPDELMWFNKNAKMTDSAKLTADICINENINAEVSALYKWTPIGEYDNKDKDKAKQYAGTFDGGGHTVSGLYIATRGINGTGMFGYAKAGSEIRNLTLSDSKISGTGNYTGGIAGGAYNMENCHVTRTVTVSGAAYVGGVSGYQNGTITRCSNAAVVVATGNNVGGVTGYVWSDATTAMTECFNIGSVKGNSVVGGLTGNLYNGGTISACYNTGAVEAAGTAGGLVGSFRYGTIKNTYHSGTITAANVGSVAGKLEWSGGQKTLEKVYVLNGSMETVGSPGGCTIQNGTAVSKPAEELKALTAAELGDKFTADTGAVNGGYPILKWQTGGAAETDPDQPTIEETGWDGKAAEPKQIGVVYQITTAAELKWFADAAKTTPGIKGKLTADIDLNHRNWTPIAAFSGELDGGGHTVSRFYCKATGTAALVAKNSGIVKNLTVSGKVIGDDNTAAIAAENTGTIENCTVLVQITGGKYTAGIAAVNSGTVRRCTNGGAVSGAQYVGGVCGQNKGTKAAAALVEDCVNTGMIRATGYMLGGIVGDNDGYSDDFAKTTVRRCANSGHIIGTAAILRAYVGGAVGRNNGTVNGLYNTGCVESLGGCVGGALGLNLTKAVKADIYNVADVMGGDYEDDGYPTDNAVSTEAELAQAKKTMGTVIDRLGSKPAISGTVTLTGKTEVGADITAAYTGSAESLLYVWYYSYDENDHVVLAITDTGKYTIPNDNMAGRRLRVKVLSAECSGVLTAETGAIEGLTGSLEIEGAAVVGRTLKAVFKSSAAYSDLRYQWYRGAETISGATKAEYTATDADLGKALKLVITSGGVAGSVMAKTTSVKSAADADMWELDQCSEPANVGGVYQISTEKELHWFASEVNGGNTAISAKLLNDIALTTDNWYPIGRKGHGFAGTFDGNGKSITNLKLTSDKDETGFFGLLTNGGKVKSLSVSGSVTATGDVSQTGGIAGAMGEVGSKSSITDCTFSGTVTGNIQVGGIIGCVGQYNQVERCANRAAVSGKGDVGGVAGANSYGVMRYCFNTGAVGSDAAKQVGGIVGTQQNYAEMVACYNTGTVTGADYVGGVAGKVYVAAMPSGCYNVGEVSAAPRCGGAVGSFGGDDYIMVKNGSFFKEINNAAFKANGAASRTEAQMKASSFVRELNSEAYGTYFTADSKSVNNGYPILLWQAGGFQVTFDARGGTCETKTVTVLEGGSLVEIPAAYRWNYHFEGWFTEMNGAGERVTTASTFTQDTTLYAHWTFNANEEAAKVNEALSRLETLRNGLGNASEEAYQNGVASITSATSLAAVEQAYQAAVVAMRKAASDYGKVQVIVANNTFAKGNGAAWDGELVNTEISLTADSTAFSCVEKALTGKDLKNSKDYILAIAGLKERDGGETSGWMITLNDWFTNEGIAAFTVANGKLTDGDVIRVLYTCDYGVDLGGTWSNCNTTLASLLVTGGTLTPAFASGTEGDQYDYTLVINGESSSVRLTPTAANKNFQVKTFLNEKVTDRTEGSSYYKSGEAISVRMGDTIYVGCGEKNWLSMNNQYGSVQTSGGTWYVLHVVSDTVSARQVMDMISALPSTDYANYKAAAADAAAARAAYNILSDGDKAAVKAYLPKLEGVEQKIKEFAAVDAFKAEHLTPLPDAADLTLAERDAVNAAKDAFDALNDTQKSCLTAAEKAKLTAAVTRMAALEKAPAQEVEKLIDAIGAVTLERETAVLTAKRAYDALTDAQKAAVSGEKLRTLEAAIAKLALLKNTDLRGKLEALYKSTGDYLTKAGTPAVGSIGGEWMVLGLSRSGRDVPGADVYYNGVVSYAQSMDRYGRIPGETVSTNARIALALAAIGKDPTNVGGKSFLQACDSMSYIKRQGTSGPVWTLIALDSMDYPTFGDVTRDKLIEAILDRRMESGAWYISITNKEDNVDMTAMAIQALAPYYAANADVKAAVDKAVSWLAAVQQADGSFAETAAAAASSESCAQVIVALTALGIDPVTDSRFTKNGKTVLDALCTFAVEGGGFRHTASGERNGMATEQAYYALAAYYRFVNGQTRLYDMTDTKNSTVTGQRVECTEKITVPDTLTGNDNLNTPEKIKAELQIQLGKQSGKSNAGNTVFMDVTLTVLMSDGSSRAATAADLTDGKITILLPYPDAVKANYDKYDFVVAHMVTMAGCGKAVGTVEFPAVTKTADGLRVTLTGLSPVAISWAEKTSSTRHYTGGTTTGKVNSSNTGDDSQMTIWLGSAVMAAAAVVVLTYKKKRASK